MHFAFVSLGFVFAEYLPLPVWVSADSGLAVCSILFVLKCTCYNRTVAFLPVGVAHPCYTTGLPLRGG